MTGNTKSPDFPTERGLPTSETIAALFLNAFVSKLTLPVNLSVKGLSLPDSAEEGVDFTLEISVANLGPAKANGVVLTFNMGEDLDYIFATSTQGGCLGAGGVVDCHIGSIDEGEEVVISFVVSPQKQGEVQQMITVESIEADTDQANNVLTQTTTVVVPEQPASTPTAVPMPTESPEPTLPSPTASLPPPPTIAEIVTQVPTPVPVHPIWCQQQANYDQRTK